ncbi:MAG: hypothetical protein KGI27_12500 [Thaumarchaeota archaeon]|nr:hypothetical protein [Nitrososphaerota archaeon]
MLLQIDKLEAILLAEKFLEQYHSHIVKKDAVWKDGVWIVTQSVGLADKKTVRVQIDSKSGRILGYSFVQENR